MTELDAKARKAKVLELLGEGYTLSDAARTVGIRPDSAREWRQSWEWWAAYRAVVESEDYKARRRARYPKPPPVPREKPKALNLGVVHAQALSFHKLVLTAETMWMGRVEAAEAVGVSLNRIQRLRGVVRRSSSPILAAHLKSAEPKARIDLEKLGGRGETVYFLYCQDRKWVKVGHAHEGCLVRRVATYHTYGRVKFMKAVYGDQKAEAIILSTFASSRIHGEWLRPGRELMGFISRLRDDGSGEIPRAWRTGYIKRRKEVKTAKIAGQRERAKARYQNDPEFRARQIAYSKQWYRRNKAKVLCGRKPQPGKYKGLPLWDAIA